MNKFTLALALGTGLTLSLAAPSAQADPIISTLQTPSISAAHVQQPVLADHQRPGDDVDLPVLRRSNRSRAWCSPRCSRGRADVAGLYAYAYQVSVSTNVTNSTTGSAPVHLDGTSFDLQRHPGPGPDLTPGANSSAYMITDGQIGGMTVP